MAIDLIFQNNLNIKFSKAQLRKLFSFATSQTHFLFNDQYFDQTDGLSMGSPLGPTLANLFMGKNEKEWLDQYDGPKVLFYRRYIDDVFCVFENGDQAKHFLNYLNTRHRNIRFTMEIEQQGVLPFLDVSISKSGEGNFETTTFRKTTFTGLLINFTSFVPLCYKFGLVKTLFNRAMKINSPKNGWEKDKDKITEILLKNSFPRKIINDVKTNLNWGQASVRNEMT